MTTASSMMTSSEIVVELTPVSAAAVVDRLLELTDDVDMTERRRS